MSDSKPVAPPAANGGTVGATTATTNGGTTKPHLYNPTSRQAYRQPYNRRHHHHPQRNYWFCCCFWTILVILILALLSAIAGSIVYVLYRPHPTALLSPSLTSVSTADSSSHISTLLNLTLSSKNPNSHLSFSYDPFDISCETSNGGVFIANGTLPASVSNSKNETSFKGVVMTRASDPDSNAVNKLRSDLKRKSEVSLKIEMDTKVRVKMDGVKSKKVGIRVTCDDIKGVVPKGKSPAVADVSTSKCKVDLQIKIWKWTF
ncbi:uncharacterized protein LOC120173516 [Hibiscus syriacus]|uniref:uncharacterized protein LOC120173516 n=1 Tax=Hibiscus syriacus TaxID=106335 RepID=UPI001921F616|nr:uncharacterized protein LOC120173516 [Hibiscus syriacus]